MQHGCPPCCHKIAIHPMEQPEGQGVPVAQVVLAEQADVAERHKNLDK
ncbi:MAG: hypothetical protein ACTHJ0_14035 [Flavipsychrobacter sp.]